MHRNRHNVIIHHHGCKKFNPEKCVICLQAKVNKIGLLKLPQIGISLDKFNEPKETINSDWLLPVKSKVFSYFSVCSQGQTYEDFY